MGSRAEVWVWFVVAEWWGALQWLEVAPMVGQQLAEVGDPAAGWAHRLLEEVL